MMESSSQNKFRAVYYNGQRAARMWERNGLYYEKVRGTKERRDNVSTDEEALLFSAKATAAPKPAKIERDITVARFWETQFKVSPKWKNLSSRTQASYTSMWENHIEPVLGERKVKGVDRADIIAVFDRMRASTHSTKVEYGQQSLYNLQTTLSAIFRVAKDRGYRLDHPVADLPASERIKQPKPTAVGNDLVYTQDELARLIEHADSERWKMMLRLAPEIGCRVSEIVGLQIKSVDFDEGSITIEWQLKREDGEWTMAPLKWAKVIGEKSRVVYPSPATMAALKVWVDGLERRFPSNWLFPQDKNPGEPTPVESALDALTRAETAAGIPHRAMKFHCFRHTFVTHYAEDGWSLDEIAQFVGDSVEMLNKRYRHFVNRDRRREKAQATAARLRVVSS